MEEVILQCIDEQSEVEIATEFPGCMHEYATCFIQGLADDGTVIFHVHYVDGYENSFKIIEVSVPIDCIVRVAKLISVTRAV